VSQAQDLELLHRQEAVFVDDDMYGGMQVALLEDAAMHAAQVVHEAIPVNAWDLNIGILPNIGIWHGLYHGA